MRKIQYKILLPLLAVAMAGCSKSDDVLPAAEEKSSAMTIMAKMEGAGATKASENAGVFSWQVEDSILVYTTAGNFAKFALTAGAGTSSATFSTTETGFEPQGLVITPAYLLKGYGTNPSSYIDETAKTTTIVLPSEYRYVEGAINSPMYAYNSSGDISSLSFKHLGAVLKITYYNVPDNARTLRLYSYGKAIKGSFEFNYADSEPTIQTHDIGGSEAVRVRFQASDVKDTMTFYIPIPLGEYTKFTIDLVSEGGTAINGSYAFFDRTNMKGTAKGPITVSRKKLVSLPMIAGSQKTSAGYSVTFQGMNASNKPLLKFVVPYGTKYNTHVITKTAFETTYGADPAKVINRYYFYNLNLAQNTATYSYTADLTAEDYVCIMAGHNDDGFQNPNGFYAMQVIPKFETPTANYSAWIGDWKALGSDFDGNPKEYTLTIGQVEPNKSFYITGWGSSEQSSMSTWKIMADYDAATNTIKIKNSMLYSYSGVWPTSSGKHNGYVLAVGVYRYNSTSLYFGWPNNCDEYPATITLTSTGEAELKGNVAYAISGEYPAATISYYVSTLDGKTFGFFTDNKKFMQFPVNLTKN